MAAAADSTLLAELRDDPVYGQFGRADFDAAAFAREVLERDAKVGKEGNDSAEIKVQVMTELRERVSLLESAIRDHVKDHREALVKGVEGLGSLRRDVEAVEFAARDVRRRSRNMSRKLLEPYEACVRATGRLRTTFEANEVLRRAQRALFSLKRLRHFGEAEDLRDMAKAAALVREVENLVHGGDRGAPSLTAIGPLAAELTLATEAREKLLVKGAEALDAALEDINQTDVQAALSLAHELGRLGPSVDGAVDRLAETAANAAKTALDADDSRLGSASSLDRGEARALADDWARSLESCALKASILDRILRKPIAPDDASSRKRTYFDELGNDASVVDRVWTAAAESTLNALQGALGYDAIISAASEPTTEEEQPLEPGEATTKTEGAERQTTMATPTKKSMADFSKGRMADLAKITAADLSKVAAKLTTADLSKAAKSLLDETTQRSKNFVESSKRRMLQSNERDDLARVRALVTALVAYYPVVRKSFIAMINRFKGGGLVLADVGGDDEKTRHTSSFGGRRFDSADPLGSVVRDAPPASFVALCEAQFKEIASAHAETCYATNRKREVTTRRAVRALEKAKLAPSSPSSASIVAHAEYARALDSAVVEHRVKPFYDAVKARPFGVDPDLIQAAQDRMDARRNMLIKPATVGSEETAPASSTPKKGKTISSLSSSSLEELVLGSLSPLRDGYLVAAAQRLLEPVILMFPEVAGYEAAVPSKQDAARLVAAARKELRDVLEEGGESTLVPAVLEQVSLACEEFGRRATRALIVKSLRHKNFESLTEAVDRAARVARASISSIGARRLGGGGDANENGTPAKRPGEFVSDVRWRANATEEHDALIATLCAQLKTSMYKLRQILPADAADDDGDDVEEETSIFSRGLAPGFAALEGVCERVSFVSLDAIAYRVEVELARAHAEDYSKAADASDDTSPSQSVERALAALEAARVGYCAALPCWLSPGQFDSPTSRASVLALAARIARSFVSHVALYRPLSGEGRLRVATDTAVLDDALASYEPEIMPKRFHAGCRPTRFLAAERRAALALKSARLELSGLKRFLFAADDEAAVASVLAEGAKLVRPHGPLRPSTVWHHVLAARGAAGIPMPHELAEPERGGGSKLAYVAWLVAGPHPSDQDSPAELATRESNAWHDVQRSLDAWASQASAEGVTDLGEVYDALRAHGAPLLASYKRAIEADSAGDDGTCT